ncbi:hypothetical protein CIB84_010712, partial [Bambusicola thoracicus]
MPDEIQTEEIIKDIFKQGKECFIPRYKPHSNHMDMLKLSSAEDISSLTLTSWNILQPSDDDSAREEALSGAHRDGLLGDDLYGAVKMDNAGTNCDTSLTLKLLHPLLLGVVMGTEQYQESHSSHVKEAADGSE